MRWLATKVCTGLHYLWWVPLWNRSAMLCCPINWACYKFPRFERWYWGGDPDDADPAQDS